MTALDSSSVRILTPAIHGDAVLTHALHSAVRRDLGRLSVVLSAPVTAVRRGALIEHTRFLLDQLQVQHRVLDEASWPAVIAIRPDLSDVADRVALTHRELGEQIRSARNSALEWRGDPKRRPDVLSAVRELLAALPPVLDQDSGFAPLIDEVLSAVQSGAQLATTWLDAPTRLARRTFWLLDDLEPRQAAMLASRTPPAVMWILRNGFSGAYNRSAYLMWTGGGSGPAV